MANKKCGKKVLTKREAEGALNKAKSHKRKYRREKRMYYCDGCNGWHLSSIEEWVEEPIKVDILEPFFAKYMDNNNQIKTKQ